MQKKAPIVYNKRAVSRGPRTKLSPELVKEIVAKSYDHSINSLVKEYKIGSRTINKLIANNPLPPRIMTREEMEPLERTGLMVKDCTKVLEQTIFTMQAVLEDEVDRLKGNLVRKKDVPREKPTISVKDLTMFFAEVAPFVLSKVEPRKQKAGEKTPLTKVHSMFVKKSS